MRTSTHGPLLRLPGSFLLSLLPLQPLGDLVAILSNCAGEPVYPVLVSWGCRNKAAHPGTFNLQTFIVLKFWILEV